VPAGEALTQRQSEDIVRALRHAEQSSELAYSVYIGSLDGDHRDHARKLHAALAEPDRSVLVAVDPGKRRLEVVTGDQAHKQLDDRSCSLAALSMTTAFAVGDLAGGLVSGVQMLAEHARRPRTLHLDQP
jgi:uncharacterized membrane protein YgcG